LKKLLPCSLEEFEKVCSLKYQLSDRRYFTSSLLVEIGGMVRRVLLLFWWKLEEWLGGN